MFGEMPDGSVGTEVVEGDEGRVGERGEVRVLEAGGVVVFVRHHPRLQRGVLFDQLSIGSREILDFLFMSTT